MLYAVDHLDPLSTHIMRQLCLPAVQCSCRRVLDEEAAQSLSCVSQRIATPATF